MSVVKTIRKDDYGMAEKVMVDEVCPYEYCDILVERVSQAGQDTVYNIAAKMCGSCIGNACICDCTVDCCDNEACSCGYSEFRISEKDLDNLILALNKVKKEM